MASFSPALPSSAMDPGDLVIALHDFVPLVSSANECLSFKAGQVIRVLNRDPGGWWDGETIPYEGEEDQGSKRGWFPSNYVVQAGPGSDVEQMALASEQHRRPSVASSSMSSGSSSMQSARSRANSIASTSQTSPMACHQALERGPRPDSPPQMSPGTGPRRQPTQSAAILETIVTALAHLQTAIQREKIPHIQPSTAYVISSVRTVLDSTDCLTKESAVLAAYPMLAKERKQILAVLSVLVDKARRATSPALAEGSGRTAELGEMLAMADKVFAHVRRFLILLQQCGIQLPDPTALKQGSGPLTVAAAAPVGSKIIRQAKSSGDIRSRPLYRRKDSESSLASGGSGGFRSSPAFGPGRHPRDGLRVVYDGSSLRNRSPTISSAAADEGPRWKPAHSASSSVSSATSSAGPLTPAGPGSHSTEDVLSILHSIHDALLSIIAAFIGHVHAHSRSSHPASYALLIDITRETIERVREILVVVEAVVQHAALCLSRPKEVVSLTEAREALYLATTGLVTAARVATSPMQASDNGADAAEDEEKGALLGSATGVLRTGNTCIASVRACVLGSGETFELVFQHPAAVYHRGAPGPSHEPQARYEDALEEPADTLQVPNGGFLGAPMAGGNRSARKARHTISMLGRKGASLACLRERWERDAEGAQDRLDEATEADEGSNWAATAQGPPVSGPRSHSRTDSLGSASMSGTSTVTNGGMRPSRPDRYPRARSHSSSRGSSRGPRGPATAAIVVPAVPGHARSGSQQTMGGESMRRDTSCTSASTAPSMTSTQSQDSSPPTSEAGSPTDDTGRGLRGVMSEDPKKGWLVPPSEPRSEVKPPVPEKTGPPFADASTKAQAHAQTRAGAAQGQQQSEPQSRDWLHERDYPPREMSFNSDGGVTGGTLRSLVERMTLHDTPIEATFSNSFFLTFRLFCDPLELTYTLITRYNLSPPADVAPATPEQLQAWTEQKVVPVRLRVYNVFKTWLELHWRPETDSETLQVMLEFARRDMASTMPTSARRLVDLIQKRFIVESSASTSTPLVPRKVLPKQRSAEQLRFGRTEAALMYVGFAHGGASTGSGSGAALLPPTPAISKNLLQQLRTAPFSSVNVSDFDPLELARQITVMECKLYCSIKPEELLGQEFSKKAGKGVNVRAMSALSTKITGWIAETILNEQDARKRTALIKFFIKLGDRCLSLQNYNALMAIMTALNSSTISRLKKTWEGLSNKYRMQLDSLQRAVNHSRNYAEYRAKLRAAQPPCLPFLGVYLTDMTFCHEGNPTHRTSPLDPSLRLINFDRYQKMGKIIGDLQRFQVPYNIMEVPECQLFIKQSLESLSHGASPDSLYRRSLLVEPREPSASGHGHGHGSSGSIGGSGGLMGLVAPGGGKGQQHLAQVAEEPYNGDHTKPLFNWKV